MLNPSSPSICSGLTLARPHLAISVFTHSDHVLQGLPFFLVLGSGTFVIDLIQDVAHYTWPYHLSHHQRRTDVMSSMPSFSSTKADGVSSLSLMPEIQRIMPWSWRWSRCILGSFGPNVSLPWSKAERTQVSSTLPRILGVRCLVVRTGKIFLNFPQAIQHLAMALSQAPPEHNMSPR